MESVIRIEALSLTFERDGQATEVLAGLDLTVRRGEFVAIVGESGVGKSTLLRVLIGLARPSAGRVRVDTSTPAPMALVFQDSRLLPWRRVIANVAFGLEAQRMPRACAERMPGAGHGCRDDVHTGRATASAERRDEREDEPHEGEGGRPRVGRLAIARRAHENRDP